MRNIVWQEPGSSCYELKECNGYRIHSIYKGDRMPIYRIYPKEGQCWVEFAKDFQTLKEARQWARAH